MRTIIITVTALLLVLIAWCFSTADAALRSTLYDSSMAILLPYVGYFVLLLTLSLCFNIVAESPAMRRYMLSQAWWLWVVHNLFGMLTLLLALMSGLFFYALVSYTLGLSPPDNLVESLQYPAGPLLLGVLVAAWGATALALSGWSGALQWLIFRCEFDHVTSLRWIVSNFLYWPLGFMAVFLFGLGSAAVFWWVDPNAVLSIGGAVLGAVVGKKLGRLAQEVQPADAEATTPLPYTFPLTATPHEELQSGRESLHAQSVGPRPRNRHSGEAALPLSTNDMALTEFRPAGPDVKVLLFLVVALLLCGLFWNVMLPRV